MNKGKLISRATRGGLSENEIQQVVQGLISGSHEPYEALLVVGRANARQYRALVDKYLTSPEDPMLSRLALQILCQYWGLADEYQDVIEMFMRKVDWDEDEDVRLMAISCAGTFLVDHQSAQLLSLLFQIFKDDSERQIVREAAYCSLALAAGKLPVELPAASRHFDLENDVDRSVIAAIETVLQEAGAL